MIKLRLAVTSEIPAMWLLRTSAVRIACASHYSPAQIDAWSASPPPSTYEGMIQGGAGLIAERDARLLGYAILNKAGAEVDAVFVDPGCAGQGVGKTLLIALEELAAKSGLERLQVFASLNAVGFYGAMGYSLIRNAQYAHPSGIELACAQMGKIL